MRFFALLWTQIILSSSLGFLLAGEGIFLNGVTGNFDSGLSEIPGTESLKFRLLRGFPGHIFFFLFFFFCLEILYQRNQGILHIYPGFPASGAWLEQQLCLPVRDRDPRGIPAPSLCGLCVCVHQGSLCLTQSLPGPTEHTAPFTQPHRAETSCCWITA